MKTQELIQQMEQHKKHLSMAKAEADNIMHYNGKNPSKALAGHIDRAIDNISDMAIFVYKGMGYKQKKVSHEKNPIYTADSFAPMRENADTKLSLAIGKINNSIAFLELLDGEKNNSYVNLIDHKTMTKVKITPKYKKHQAEALDAAKAASKLLSKVSFG